VRPTELYMRTATVATARTPVVTMPGTGLLQVRWGAIWESALDGKELAPSSASDGPCGRERGTGDEGRANANGERGKRAKARKAGRVLHIPSPSPTHSPLARRCCSLVPLPSSPFPRSPTRATGFEPVTFSSGG